MIHNTLGTYQNKRKQISRVHLLAHNHYSGSNQYVFQNRKSAKSKQRAHARGMRMFTCPDPSCACACLRCASTSKLAIAFTGFNDENQDGYRAEDALVTGCPGVRIVVRRLMSSDIDFNGRLR